MLVTSTTCRQCHCVLVASTTWLVDELWHVVEVPDIYNALSVITTPSCDFVSLSVLSRALAWERSQQAFSFGCTVLSPTKRSLSPPEAVLPPPRRGGGRCPGDPRRWHFLSGCPFIHVPFLTGTEANFCSFGSWLAVWYETTETAERNITSVGLNLILHVTCH